MGQKESKSDGRPEDARRQSSAKSLGPAALPSAAISFAASDAAFVRRVVDLLQAEKRAVFVRWEESLMTPEVMDEVHSGIESGDCFVAVLSPAYVDSEHCDFQLTHAVKCGKRIIPVVWRPLGPSQARLRPELQELQWLFMDDEQAFATQSRLLQAALNEEADHVRMHTHLLKKGLAWERKRRLKSLLLSKDEQRAALNFLDNCAKGLEPHAVPLHIAYMSASLRRASSLANVRESIYMERQLQPNVEGHASLFVSFAMEDLAFTKALCDLLSAQGKRRMLVEFKEPETTREAVELMKSRVQEADAMLLVVSPDSLLSERVQWEIDHAVHCGKRIVPVLCRHSNMADARKEIVRLQWVPMVDAAKDPQLMAAAAQRVAAALDRDLRHLRYHTQLLLFTIFWLQGGLKDRLLLQGADVQSAVDWTAASALGREPRPVQPQLDFVSASCKKESLWMKARVKEVRSREQDRVDPTLPIYCPADWMLEVDRVVSGSPMGPPSALDEAHDEAAMASWEAYQDGERVVPSGAPEAEPQPMSPPAAPSLVAAAAAAAESEPAAAPAAAAESEPAAAAPAAADAQV